MKNPRDRRPHRGRALPAALRLGVDVAAGAEGLDERVLGQPADVLPEDHRLHEGDVVRDQQQGAQVREVDPGDLRSKSRREERTHHGRGALGLLEVVAGLLVDAPGGEVRLDNELGVLVRSLARSLARSLVVNEVLEVELVAVEVLPGAAPHQESGLDLAEAAVGTHHQVGVPGGERVSSARLK